MSPNAVALWFNWGLEHDILEKSSLPATLQFRGWKDGGLISRNELHPDLEQRFGAPYLVIHRAELHNVLYQHTRKLGVTIRVNSRAVDYDLNTPAITFANGEIAQPDLVIAVDGKWQPCHGLELLNGYVSNHDVQRDQFACENQAHGNKKCRDPSHRDRCVSACG